MCYVNVYVSVVFATENKKSNDVWIFYINLYLNFDYCMFYQEKSSLIQFSIRNIDGSLPSGGDVLCVSYIEGWRMIKNYFIKIKKRKKIKIKLNWNKKKKNKKIHPGLYKFIYRKEINISSE